MAPAQGAVDVQPVQVLVVGSHSGVVPPHCESDVHAGHSAHAPDPLQQGVAGSEHVPVVAEQDSAHTWPTQYGALASQSAFVVQVVGDFGCGFVSPLPRTATATIRMTATAIPTQRLDDIGVILQLS